jgi:DSF synthase
MKTGNSLRAAAPKNVTPLGRLAQATDPKTPTQLELWSNNNFAPAREQVAVARARTDFSGELAGVRFSELDLTVSPHEEAIWCYMRPNGPPSFTPTLLHELIAMRRLLQRLFAGSPACARARPLR